MNRLVKHNVAFVGHPRAIAITVPYGKEYWCVKVGEAIFPEERGDSFGRFDCVVKRHRREEMVYNMCVLNVMKYVIENPPEISVNCGQSPTQRVPLFIAEMWHIRIGVLQLGNDHQPAVDHQIGQEVYKEHPRECVSFAQQVQHVADNDKSHVRHDDSNALIRLEAHRVRVKVARPSRVLLTGGVCEQVQRPPEEVENEDVQYSDGSGELDRIIDVDVALRVWNEHLVALHLAAKVVMHSVCVLP